jgi:hypothetical protein
VEQRSILWNYANVASKVGERDVGDILLVYEDPAGGRFVESEEQAENGAFATSARSDNGDFLPAWYGEGDVPEDGSSGGVPK